jgi:hypothetical protein
MIKHFLIGISLIALFTGCEEDIKINIPSKGKKAVIEGHIENGLPAEVIITRNHPLFSTISGTALSDYLVMDAKVMVSNGLFTDTLTLTVDTTASIPVVYKGHTILGIPGQTYNLTVIADGKTYTASTTIPTPVPLDSVWFKRRNPQDTLGLGYAWARLSEPAGFGNGYKWFAKRVSFDRRFIAPYGSTTDDKWTDGKTFDFFYDAGIDPTVTSDGEQGFFKVGDLIIIKFCSIDHATTNFYETFEQSVGTNGNPFASPVTILGNITSDGEEQLGIWAGFGASYDTIHAQ